MRSPVPALVPAAGCRGGLIRFPPTFTPRSKVSSLVANSDFLRVLAVLTFVFLCDLCG